MALTFSERFRMSEGGRAWRVIEITHAAGAGAAITAASMDLTYIEGIVGQSLNLPVGAGSLSDLCGGHGVSIAVDHQSLIWTATQAVSTQNLTIVGW